MFFLLYIVAVHKLCVKFVLKYRTVMPNCSKYAIILLQASKNAHPHPSPSHRGQGRFSMNSG